MADALATTGSSLPPAFDPAPTVTIVLSTYNERDPLIKPAAPDLSLLATSKAEYVAIAGFRASAVWQAGFVLLCVVTGGVLWIMTTWWPQIYTYLARVRVRSLGVADIVLVRDSHGLMHECAVVHSEGGMVRTFEWKHQRYLYIQQSGSFERVPAMLLDSLESVTRSLQTGLASSVVADRTAFYGPNTMELKTPSLIRLLVEKVVHPFYLFQLISVALWLEEAYTTYALAILAMSISSIAYEVHSQVTNASQMQALVACAIQVQVKRDGGVQSVPASALVLGDFVLVQEQVVAADMVIVVGECMADESSLTGEAIPVSKQPSHDDPTKSVLECHKSSVLCAGSTVVRVKGDSVWAVVTRVGFSTTKGDLLRQILYPDDVPFQMVTDSYRYLLALSIVAGLTSLQRIYDAIQAHSTLGDLVISVFDLISTTIPAALPMILTVGVGFSLTRLQQARLCCIDAQKINVAGHINCFCFDKTGTLTSDHLDFEGVDMCDGSPLTTKPTSRDVEYALASCHGLSVDDQGVVAGYSLERDMFAATEYTLSATTNEVQSPNGGHVSLRYDRRYPFDAALQRSSVVVQASNEPHFRRIYVKGSPEAIADICTGIPSDFYARVHRYASEGLYCVALAMKKMDGYEPATSRATVESDVTFLGFLLFLNPIKAASRGVIETLERANIDVRIITGDNALTAMHVARELNMHLTTSMLYLDVSPSDGSIMYQLYPTSTTWLALGDLDTLLDLDFDLTITGAALDVVIASSLPPLLVSRLVQKAKIFARTKPHTKTWIVGRLMDAGLFVGMTGDGTNDCGALKAAHVGLALSDAEASIGMFLSSAAQIGLGVVRRRVEVRSAVVVAPFTSRGKAIEDVVALLREGRCALTTSLLSFKFMVMYPIIETAMVAYLNHMQASFSNNQYLFGDMFVVLGMSVLMLQTPPAANLTKARPPTSLFSPTIVWSVASQSVVFALYFSATLAVAQRQPWFCALPDVAAGRAHCYPYRPNESGDMTTHAFEVSIVWLLGHWHYVVLAIAFNLNDPFREPAWHNRAFVLYTAAVGAILLGLVLWPGTTASCSDIHEPSRVGNAMAVAWLDLTTPLPLSFCFEMAASCALALVTAVGVEMAVRITFAQS
ncbi:hypothetical protein, variant 5 [Aphanomyces invadans]|uniref:Cation-transporting ATPase n=1 Tax=Aphanomyces invadans TaxID=157072 RepID=A0A024UMT6_9STRA|nr:hypothetical protein, variant 5 [Aphanomyces invadans]XP_008863281.1 hypothetical protein, variant 3 [Aphanomyces invadans]ETW07175.1 hypothetical protein, variant 3 [Aphanomyces invadans]ETW07177.1 hypothetical protein, variant 5 [Aphanomyces invadans]|eukprot:XP_008863267.1 hypothetical protein, variant 5 [Aphanomyces invadans]